MGLYDGYRLSNSNRVPEYQGSAVPEMVAVSAQLQKQYDTAQDRQDYAGQYLNSMTSLHQDAGEFNKVKGEITNKLSVLSKRPDLENAVRESTMLAQQLPQAYAPFAQRMKDVQEVQEGYNKRVVEGKLSPDQAKRFMEQDMIMDGGIKKDPATGKYNGRFVGQQNVDDFDTRKAIDEIFDKTFPSTQGWTNEGPTANGQWMFKNGSTTKILSRDAVTKMTREGLSQIPGWNSHVKQEQDLSTYKLNYRKNPLEGINFDAVVGNKLGNSTKDKKGHVKQNYLPVTLKEEMELRMQEGEDSTNILKSVQGRMVGNNLMQGAIDYALSKYPRNDKETVSGITGANPYEINERNKKPFAGTPFEYEGAGIDLGGNMPTDPKKVITSIETTTAQIADLTNTINSGQLDNVQRSKAESKRDLLTMAKSRLESFNKTVGKEVETQMGYDYTKLQSLKTGNSPMVTKDGQKTTVGELVTASENNGSYTNGNIDKTKSYIKTVDPSGGYGANAQAYLVTPDGKEHELNKEDFTTMMGHKDQIARYQKKYNDIEENVTKDKALNFSVTPKVISLDEGTKTSINNALHTGNPGIVVMDGTGKILEDNDIPEGLTVNGITSEKIGDNHYLDASVVSTDKKTQEKYKKTKFYVKFAGENSAAEDAANGMLKSNNPRIRATGEDILSNNYRNLLSDKLRDNQSVEVSVKGYGKVTVDNSVINGLQSYRILDSSGNVINLEGVPAVSGNLSNIGKALKRLEK